MNNPEAIGNQETSMNVGPKAIETGRGKFSPGQLIRLTWYCLTHFEDGEIEIKIPPDINPNEWRIFANKQFTIGRHTPECKKTIEYIDRLGSKEEPDIPPASSSPRKRIRKTILLSNKR